MVLATLAFVAVATMQQGPGSAKVYPKASDRNWVFVRNDPLKFDPNNIISYDGKVVGIIESGNVSLMVRVRGGATSIVDLGPKRYFDAQSTHLKLHDAVSIKGSKVIQDGRGAVLCTELSHHGSRIAFRTADGRPLWSR